MRTAGRRFFVVLALCALAAAICAASLLREKRPEPPDFTALSQVCTSAKFEYIEDAQQGYKFITSEIFTLSSAFGSLDILPAEQAFPEQDWIYRITFNWYPEPDRNVEDEILVLVFDDHMCVDGVDYVGNGWDSSQLVTDIFGPKYQYFDYELCPYTS